MFQPGAVVVKVGLVQLPRCCGESKRTLAGPAAATTDVVVDPPVVVVVVVDPPASVVVVLEPPLAVVVVDAVDPPDDGGGVFSAGSFPLLDRALLALDELPPVSPLIHMPTIAATTIAVSSCHVFQVRRSLIFRSPGCGIPEDAGPLM